MQLIVHDAIKYISSDRASSSHQPATTPATHGFTAVLVTAHHAAMYVYVLVAGACRHVGAAKSRVLLGAAVWCIAS